MKTQDPQSVEQEAYTVFRMLLENYARYFYGKGIDDAKKLARKKKEVVKRTVKKTKKNSEAG